MEQILDGLAFAHAKGVVHRDLKPGNIHVLPERAGQDHGLRPGPPGRTARPTGVIMGTPYYMAPEQVQGEQATARSDIFSLGAMFYELLAGRRPFTGPTIPAVLFGVVHRDPEPLEQVAPGGARRPRRRGRRGPWRRTPRRALRERRRDAPGRCA